jgi:uncharacterized protein YfaS (alpha-2-macroglobulin family)
VKGVARTYTGAPVDGAEAEWEVTRDAATHFFLDRLPAGTHVFEIATRVQHAGVYQSGAAEIRCMYAPEFQARSDSTRLEVLPLAEAADH